MQNFIGMLANEITSKNEKNILDGCVISLDNKI
jgi:hypothetical protein